MSDRSTKPKVSEKSQRPKKQGKPRKKTGLKSSEKPNNNVDIPALVRLVAIGAELERDPDMRGSAIMRAVSKTRDTGAFTKFWEKMAPWLGQAVFKHKMTLDHKVLWDDVKLHEHGIAKRSFPKAKISRAGFNVYGANVVAATKLYLDLISLSRDIKRPLSESLPSFAAAQIDAARKVKELAEEAPFHDDYEAGPFKEPKPWDYHKIKDGRHSLEFRSITIPEAWKQCVELTSPELVEIVNPADAIGASLGGFFPVDKAGQTSEVTT